MNLKIVYRDHHLFDFDTETQLLTCPYCYRRYYCVRQIISQQVTQWSEKMVKTKIIWSSLLARCIYCDTLNQSYPIKSPLKNDNIGFDVNRDTYIREIYQNLVINWQYRQPSTIIIYGLFAKMILRLVLNYPELRGNSNIILTDTNIHTNDQTLHDHEDEGEVEDGDNNQLIVKKNDRSIGNPISFDVLNDQTMSMLIPGEDSHIIIFNHSNWSLFFSKIKIIVCNSCVSNPSDGTQSPILSSSGSNDDNLINNEYTNYRMWINIAYKQISSKPFPPMIVQPIFSQNEMIYRVRDVNPQLIADMFLSTPDRISPFKSLFYLLTIILNHQETIVSPSITIDECNSVISWILGSVCRINRTLYPTQVAGSSEPPVFDCGIGHVPSLTIERYLSRWSRYINQSNEVLISALIYLDRFLSHNPGFILTEYNVHRLFVGAIIASIKFNDDHFYTNKYYATIAGISINELNTIEYVFYDRLDFQLFVDHILYEDYYNLISHLISFYRSNI